MLWSDAAVYSVVRLALDDSALCQRKSHLRGLYRGVSQADRRCATYHRAVSYLRRLARL